MTGRGIHPSKLWIEWKKIKGERKNVTFAEDRRRSNQAILVEPPPIIPRVAAARETPTIYKRFEPGRIGEPLRPARAAASWGTIRHPMVKIEAPSQLAEKLEARARARAAALALLERGRAELVGRIRVSTSQPSSRRGPRVVTMTIVVVVIDRRSIKRLETEKDIATYYFSFFFLFPNQKVE